MACTLTEELEQALRAGLGRAAGGQAAAWRCPPTTWVRSSRIPERPGRLPQPEVEE